MITVLSMNLTGMIKRAAGSTALILFAGCTVPGSPDTFSTPAVRESKPAASAVTRATAPAEPVAKEIDPTIPFGTLDEHIGSIKLTNGIGPREASILATAYFMRYEGLCGAVVSLRRDSSAWRAFTMAGPNGAPGNDIFIDVHTGAISQKRHPTVHPPWNALRVIQDIYDERMSPP